METNKNQKKQIILSVFIILSLVLITIGVTYAIFTYTKLGSTENTITTGTLKFIYIENTGVGNGVNITNALPVSDEVGKAYSTDNQVFDFSIEATNTSNETIPYEVTLRQKKDSTLPSDIIKIYLTDRTEGIETDILSPVLYSSLTQTKIDVGDNIEKTIYNDIVNSNDLDYVKDFRLRMWIDGSADFSSTGTDEDGNPIYPYNNKSFTVTVNVYANAKVVEQTEAENFATTILKNNTIVETEPNLNIYPQSTSDPLQEDTDGLYSSTNTNTGEETYYFRGNVENNYVLFAGLNWRIVRINEDETVRLMATTSIEDSPNLFNSISDDFSNAYYSNSDAKITMENWYNNNLSSYDEKIARGDYYCEQAKVSITSGTMGNATLTIYSSYNPTFKCETDANGKGIVNAKIGLLTYDELVYSGATGHLYNNEFWTMSPSLCSSSNACVWGAMNNNNADVYPVDEYHYLTPVINLNKDVTVTGTGTILDPYIVNIYDTTKYDYTIGQKVTTIDGSTWHVLENSEKTSDKVVLMSDYNLNSDGSYGSSTSYQSIAFDSDGTNVYNEEDSNNIGYFLKNTYQPLVTTSLPGTTDVTLPTVEQIAIASQKSFNQGYLRLPNSWLVGSYWTKTANTTTTEVWAVNGTWSAITSSSANNNYYYGIRPVITTLKTNLVTE